MVDSFGEQEVSSLFCPRCQRATPERKKLLLVLPSGNKYDYTCSVCGTQVGGKTDSNTADFHRLASTARRPPPPNAVSPGFTTAEVDSPLAAVSAEHPVAPVHADGLAGDVGGVV